MNRTNDHFQNQRLKLSFLLVFSWKRRYPRTPSVFERRQYDHFIEDVIALLFSTIQQPTNKVTDEYWAESLTLLSWFTNVIVVKCYQYYHKHYQINREWFFVIRRQKSSPYLTLECLLLFQPSILEAKPDGRVSRSMKTHRTPNRYKTLPTSRD